MASLPLKPVVANIGKCRNDTSHSQRKTSSERGYKFRAKRAKYEAELVFAVTKLRNELAQLRFLHTVWQQKAVLLRNSDFGSLVQLVRELFRVFAKGLECESQDPTGTEYSVVQFKENFLRHVVDPDVEIGEDVGGVDMLIEQWRRYTAAYADFHVEVEPAVVMCGPPEDPVLEVLVKMSGRFTHDTFRIMFPYAVHRQDLTQYFVGNAFVFDNMHNFRFTPDGRIKIYTLQVNFVEALVRTSGSLEAAAELLELSVISPC
uniref:BZIP domain-containing protein n=1 Tax=Globisporangium ultimum (strain ATCC 200006 / CBS 805.95 / DAOM BR144) TaxID=431595 RepID=K3X4U8_GLOUD